MKNIKRSNLKSNKKLMLFKKIKKLYIALKLFLSRCVLNSFLNINKKKRNMKSIIIVKRLWLSQCLTKTSLLLKKLFMKKNSTNKWKLMLINSKKITRFTITSQSKKKNQIIFRPNRKSNSLPATLSLKKLRSSKIQPKSSNRIQSHKNISITNTSTTITDQKRVNTKK